MKKILLNLASLALISSTSLSVTACYNSSNNSSNQDKTALDLQKTSVDVSPSGPGQKNSTATDLITNYSDLKEFNYSIADKTIVTNVSISMKGTITITTGQKIGTTTVVISAVNKYNQKVSSTITVNSKYDVYLTNENVSMNTNSQYTQLIIQNADKIGNINITTNNKNIDAAYNATNGQVTITSINNVSGSFQLKITGDNIYTKYVNITVNKTSIVLNNPGVETKSTPLVLQIGQEDMSLKILNYGQLTQLTDKISIQVPPNKNLIKSAKINPDGTIDIIAGSAYSKTPVELTITNPGSNDLNFYVVVGPSKNLKLSANNSTVYVGGKSQSIFIEENDIKITSVNSNSTWVQANYDFKTNSISIIPPSYNILITSAQITVTGTNLKTKVIQTAIINVKVERTWKDWEITTGGAAIAGGVIGAIGWIWHEFHPNTPPKPTPPKPGQQATLTAAATNTTGSIINIQFSAGAIDKSQLTAISVNGIALNSTTMYIIGETTKQNVVPIVITDSNYYIKSSDNVTVTYKGTTTQVTNNVPKPIPPKPTPTISLNTNKITLSENTSNDTVKVINDKVVADNPGILSTLGATTTNNNIANAIFNPDGSIHIKTNNIEGSTQITIYSTDSKYNNLIQNVSFTVVVTSKTISWLTNYEDFAISNTNIATGVNQTNYSYLWYIDKFTKYEINHPFSDNPNIATATINSNGAISITGHKIGTTNINIVNISGKVLTISVTVNNKPNITASNNILALDDSEETLIIATPSNLNITTEDIKINYFGTLETNWGYVVYGKLNDGQGEFTLSAKATASLSGIRNFSISIPGMNDLNIEVILN